MAGPGYAAARIPHVFMKNRLAAAAEATFS
jgi:hypothetical protein